MRKITINGSSRALLNSLSECFFHFTLIHISVFDCVCINFEGIALILRKLTFFSKWEKNFGDEIDNLSHSIWVVENSKFWLTIFKFQVFKFSLDNDDSFRDQKCPKTTRTFKGTYYIPIKDLSDMQTPSLTLKLSKYKSLYYKVYSSFSSNWKSANIVNFFPRRSDLCKLYHKSASTYKPIQRIQINIV